MSLTAVDGTSAVIHDYDSTASRSLSLASLEAPTSATSYAMHHSVLTERTSPPPRIPEEEDSLSDGPSSQRTQLFAPSDDEWPLHSNFSGEPLTFSGSGSPDTPLGSPTFERIQHRPRNPPQFHQSISADSLHPHTNQTPLYLSSSVDALRTRPLPKTPLLRPHPNQQALGRKRASSVNMPTPVVPSDPFEKLRKRVERAAKEDRLRTLDALEGGPRSPVPPPTYAEGHRNREVQQGYDIAESKLREAFDDKLDQVDLDRGGVEWLAL